MCVTDSGVIRAVAVCCLLFLTLCPRASGQISETDSPVGRRTDPPLEGYIEEEVPFEVGEAAARADEALMKKLQQEVEALPEELTYEMGVEILRSHVDEFQTLDARQRVLFSIANIYRHLGNKEEARRHYEEVIAMPSFDPHLPSMAKRELAEMLAIDGKTDDTLRILRDRPRTRPRASDLNQPGVSSPPAQRKTGIDDEFMTLLAEAEVLQRAGSIEESLEIPARLEREWSSPTRIELLVPVACISIVAADMQHRYEDELELYEQLFEKIPVLRDRPGLLSNRIMIAREAQMMDLATQLTEEYLDEYGDTRTATGHLYLLAEDAEAKGDKELAARYYELVVQHPESTEEYVTYAKADLERVRTGRVIQIAEPESHSFWTPLVVIHVAIIGLVVVGRLVLKLRRRPTDG